MKSRCVFSLKASTVGRTCDHLDGVSDCDSEVEGSGSVSDVRDDDDEEEEEGCEKAFAFLRFGTTGLP